MVIVFLSIYFNQLLQASLYESLQNHQLSVQQQPKNQLCASGTIIMCIYKSIKLLPIDPGMISNFNYLNKLRNFMSIVSPMICL